MLAELTKGRAHVSELARRLEMSRPLLYMHLDRLEKANLVEGELELAADGKSRKYFTAAAFSVSIDLSFIAEVMAQEAPPENVGQEPEDDTEGVDG